MRRSPSTSTARLDRKAKLVRRLQKYTGNPVVKALVWVGTARSHIVLETVGRRTGKRRRVPVAYGRTGQVVWIVAEHGRRSDFVRNIEADPAVRVRLGRRWHTGTAELLPEDDPESHLGPDIHQRHAPVIKALGTELMTVRINLDGR